MATFEGRVETPETPQSPDNYIVKQGHGAKSVEEIDKLIAHATQHGYSPEGQTLRFLQTRRTELASPKSARGGRK